MENACLTPKFPFPVMIRSSNTEMTAAYARDGPVVSGYGPTATQVAPASQPHHSPVRSSRQQRKDNLAMLHRKVKSIDLSI